MAKDPKELMNDLKNGAVKLSKIDSARMTAWNGLTQAVFKSGALDAKTKELIAASLGLAARCDYCIVHHVHEALKEGATREELIEAAFTTIGMSGGPSVTYAATLYLDSIEAFAPEFGK